MKCRVLTALAVCLIAVPLAAQQPGLLVYVSANTVKPGRGMDYVNNVKKSFQPMFEKIMKESVVLGWGLDAVELHHQGEPAHYMFFVLPTMRRMTSAKPHTEKWSKT